MTDPLPQPTQPRTSHRRLALLVALAVQGAELAYFFPAHPAAEADNVRYEEMGASLATGQGLSLPFELNKDAKVRAWACGRHPAWCEGDRFPTAVYAPAYPVFIAAVYRVVGKSPFWLLLVQCALHLLLIAMVESVAARLLPPAGYGFVMAVAAVYPFLARQATMVMSDHLHAVFLFAALWAVTVLRRDVWRTGALGLFYALANLARPYSVVALPFFFLPAVRRAVFPTRGALLAFLVALGVPHGLWVARNAVVYGRFLPFTTAGIGSGLYLNKTEAEIGSALEPGNSERIYAELYRVGGDITTMDGDRALRDAAVAWLWAHPLDVLEHLPLRLVRVWVSVGYQGQGLHPLAYASMAFLVGLLGLGVAGMWRTRRDPRFWPFLILVGAYWAFLLHTPAEARRSLALRMPLLILAGSCVAGIAERVRRKPAKASDQAADEGKVTTSA